eukprot:8030390-Pyramimonas_sp.AAC.1
MPLWANAVFGGQNNDDHEVFLTKGERRQLQSLVTDSKVSSDLKSRSFLEVFSPPRVAPLLEEAGLRTLGSLDLATGWDFRKNSDHDRAMGLVRTKKPWVIFLGPPC